MRVNNIEKNRDRIIGLRPVYTSIGDSTELILDKGEVFLEEISIRSVLSRIFRSYAIDPQAQHNQLRNRLDRKSVLPFYLPGGRVFIPLKMRLPIASNDTSYGYLDCQFMDLPEKETGGKCSVELVNGVKVELNCSYTTAISAHNLGRKLQSIVLERNESEKKTEEITAAAVILAKEIIAMGQKLEQIHQRLIRGG